MQRGSTPNCTLPGGFSVAYRAGRHKFSSLGFLPAFRVIFWQQRCRAPQLRGSALELRCACGFHPSLGGKSQQFPYGKSLPLRASPVGQVWAVEIRGHRSPRGLFSLGARFSHLCCFSAGAAIAEGCSAPLPAGTRALWSARCCYAMGAEAGRAWKTTSRFSSKVSRPLGACRQCCRAGISCSKP